MHRQIRLDYLSEESCENAVTRLAPAAGCVRKKVEAPNTIATPSSVATGNVSYGIPSDIAQIGEPIEQVVLDTYPKQHNRAFVSDWFKRYKWLQYSVEKDAAFCYPCQQFLPHGSKQTSYTSTGFRNWKMPLILKLVFQNMKNQSHIQAMSMWQEKLQRISTSSSVETLINQKSLKIPSREEASVVKAYLSRNEDIMENTLQVLYRQREAFKDTYELFASVATIGCSTAVCESTFSTLTAINRPQRLSMGHERMAGMITMINNSETKPTRSLRSLRWPARRERGGACGQAGRGVQLYEIPCRAAHSRGRLPTERESSVERSQRLASQNFRTLANRQRESSADRSQRLASQNARTLANRDRESSAERSQRLASQNSRTLANRDRESSAERSQRLTQQNARSTRNRTRRQHNLLNAALLMIVPLTILS
ncbi:hypothetical protein EVAR_79990_1 [Eumeta japonica]|uniref:TTF-type domain-containing protein n=1 Tax=Eumeta variegata TaxID=151549 RepID=A0A4C1ZV16_EUMVA|nr:hypothetical protein EVAR_79990_1 [Eumeta japonica]